MRYLSQGASAVPLGPSSPFKRTARRGGSRPEGIWILLQPIDLECEIYLKHRAGLISDLNCHPVVSITIIAGPADRIPSHFRQGLCGFLLYGCDVPQFQPLFINC